MDIYKRAFGTENKLIQKKKFKGFPHCYFPKDIEYFQKAMSYY
jgi:hypothetical protein